LAIASTNKDVKGFIKIGNERVLAARLYDAKFFWDEDRKKTLISRTNTLKRQTFQNDLGTYTDKIERMKQIVEILANHIEFHKTNAIDTVTLCKCDLATDMVYEFPELQGIMGGLYAKEEGQNEDIWKGIYDHYKPTSMEDDIPRTDAGIVTSIADKTDTFLGCLAVGIIPTGSKDPFGLRRASGSIIKIIFEKNLDFDFYKFIEDCLPVYEGLLKTDIHQWKKHIFEIFDARISFLLEKQGFKYDEIDAVMAIPHSKLIDTANRAKALQKTRNNSEFQKVASSFKRINNILAKNKAQSEIKEQLLKENAEVNLFNALNGLKDEVKLLISNKNYTKTLAKISEIADTVDNFFDKVLVMDKDEAIKNNRLALLNKLKEQFLKVADFSKLVIK
jgi:glycyl-tRNA synthetase beta chain